MSNPARLVSITIIVLSVVATGVAKADWDFTKWSMSTEQVITASNGRAQMLATDRAKAESTFVGRTCLVQLTGPYTVGGVSFQKVNFCFDPAGKLASVDLYAPSGEFEAVDRALASAFGAPAKSEGGSLPSRIYLDRAKGNSLRLVRVASTILSYQPIPTGF